MIVILCACVRLWTHLLQVLSKNKLKPFLYTVGVPTLVKQRHEKEKYHKVLSSKALNRGDRQVEDYLGVKMKATSPLIRKAFSVKSSKSSTRLCIYIVIYIYKYTLTRMTENIHRQAKV